MSSQPAPVRPLQSQHVLLPNPLRLLCGPCPPTLSAEAPAVGSPHAPCSGASLSAVEDLERNDGTAERPYFMSLTLKKLLNKTNKKPVES